MSEVVKIQQTVIPQKVYVGDTVTIQCVFNSASEDLKTNGIGINNFVYNIDQDFIEIQKVELQQKGTDFYNLVISLVPWQTGKIDLPQLAFENGKYYIEFNSFYVSSLVSEKENMQLRKIQTPLLLPGTTYALYGSIIAFIIFLIVLLNLIIRHKKVMSWIKRKKRNCMLKKNKKKALRAIASLENQKIAQKEFAKRLQEIARKYFEVRFEKSFTKYTTSQIKEELNNNQDFNNIPETIKNSLIELFIQTDLIRYGKENSVKDSEFIKYAGSLRDLINEIEKFFYDELKKEIAAGVM